MHYYYSWYTSAAQQHQADQKDQDFFGQESNRAFFNSGDYQPKGRSSFFSGNTVQPKLQIGRADDKYEQEADRTAELIVDRVSSPAYRGVNPQPSISPLQRKCEKCKEEEEEVVRDETTGNPLRRKPIFASDEDDRDQGSIQQKCAVCDAELDQESIQQKASRSGSNPASDHLSAKLNQQRGKGEQLSGQTRSEMESGFGRDFSHVRIHTDSTSSAMNHELKARAFTHGSDIYFNTGQYNSNSQEGKRLLAHELTHVVQQGGGDSGRTVQMLPGAGGWEFRYAKQAPYQSRKYEKDKQAQQEIVDQTKSKFAKDGQRLGVVKWDKSPKLKLRSETTTGNQENIIEQLPFNSKLKIYSDLPGDWYKVKSELGNIGYVAKNYISTGLPDPDAKLHRIESGISGYAISIAEKFYKPYIIDGIDLRHFVNVLAEVNLGYNLDGSWKKVSFKANQFIWIPGLLLAQKLIASQKGINLENKIIDEFTSWAGTLDESGLGYYLFKLAKSSPAYFTTILAILNKLDSGDRDEVSYEFIKPASKYVNPSKSTNFTYIDKFLKQGGLELIDRMFKAMSTDWISDDDEEGSIAILHAKMRSMPIQDLLNQSKDPPIFPLRQMGITVLDDAPLSAKWIDGQIAVDYPRRVCGTNKFRREIQALSKYGDPCSYEIRLDPNQLVGVKLYDEGEVIQYIPASGLILYSNLTKTSTITKIGEVSSLAIGGLGGWAVKGAGWFAKTVIWADRIAAAIGILTTIINEHKSWIIKTFPKYGPKFLVILNQVNLAASLYGIGRLVTGVGFTSVKALRKKWKQCQSENQRYINDGVSHDLEDGTKQLLESVNKGRISAMQKATNRPYRNLPETELNKLIQQGDEVAAGEMIYRQLNKKFKSEDDFLAHTKSLESPKLNIEEARLELELAKAGGVKRPLKDDPYYTEEISFNNHTWRKTKKSNTWCRHSDDVLCYTFGDTDGISIKSFGRRGETKDPAHNLRKNLGDPPTKVEGWEAHHIIPFEQRNHKVIQFIRRQFQRHWNINDANNGIFLPKTRDIPGAGKRSLHRGDHSFYNGVIETRLDELEYLWITNQITDDELLMRVQNLQQYFRNKLLKGHIPLAKEK